MEICYNIYHTKTFYENNWLGIVQINTLHCHRKLFYKYNTFSFKDLYKFIFVYVNTQT